MRHQKEIPHHPGWRLGLVEITLIPSGIATSNGQPVEHVDDCHTIAVGGEKAVEILPLIRRGQSLISGSLPTATGQSSTAARGGKASTWIDPRQLETAAESWSGPRPPLDLVTGYFPMRPHSHQTAVGTVTFSCVWQYVVEASTVFCWCSDSSVAVNKPHCESYRSEVAPL